MIIKRILIGALITLSVVFLAFQIFKFEVGAAGIRVVLLILLTVFYCHNVKNKHVLFLAFLISFGIAEILNFMAWIVPTLSRNQVDYIYYSGNSVYIIAYVFLIIQMLSSMNLLEIVKKFPVHILIMIILDVFCVVVVTDTTLNRLSYSQYYMEFVYNAVIMILLTVALINFIYKDDKKAINLLIGSIFIVFSEVIQLAYFYVTNINILNVFCSLFLVIAFLFFYLQSTLEYQPLEKTILYQDSMS